jgi:hypothetical protein
VAAVPKKYFEWLARYLAPPQGKNARPTLSQIAREEKKDQRTISRGVRRAAEILGLSVPDTRG